MHRQGLSMILTSHHLSISDASKILDVSFDTIRRWEKKGLLKAHRAANGHRYFDKNELDRLIARNSGGGDVGYKVLKAKRSSGYSVVELFAGAGGLALGLENAGLECRALVEIDKNAVQTLRVNRPQWNVFDDDIANIDFMGIDADVVAGGFPCQAFSYAGKRMGFEDTRGTLFFEYARAINQIKPKVIIGENVRGLERHDNGRTLGTMLSVLDELFTRQQSIDQAAYLTLGSPKYERTRSGLFCSMFMWAVVTCLSLSLVRTCTREPSACLRSAFSRSSGLSSGL